MVKEENKFGYGLRGKLISAIAMLLVAVIMVVSSTYAWFTLSTAPEVTGITTAVGANGALEMLLLTKDEEGNWVYGSGTLAAGADSNTYWGNLVTFSDQNGRPKYGADKITLYPALLTTEGGNKLASSPLSTPVYGADGRVSGLNPNTVYGIYSSAKDAFLQSDDDYGFRGVGVASGMTPRQLAFRNARSQISALMASARNAASDSLTNNGSTLANIAMKKALQTSPTFTKAEVEAINTMITDLEEALGYIEDAYFQAYLAFGASKLTGDEELLYNTIKGLVDNSATINDLDTAIKNALTDAGVPTSVPATITNGIAEYNRALAAVNSAKNEYETIDQTKDEYVWADFSAALSVLVNMESIKINGYSASEASANKGAIIEQALSSGILVTMTTGGGVYAGIADQAKDYKVDIRISLASLGYDMEIGAKMDTQTTVNPVYLDAVYQYLSQPTMEPTSNDTTMPLTEFYGYVIDLAFRTNAAQSNLLLQQQGVDRIYSDNNNEETMGAGSSMTFASSDNNFSAAQVKKLMANIRIVFFNTGDDTIYGYAKLDMANATTTADGVTAYMYLYKTVENAYKAADGTIVFAKTVEVEGADPTVEYYTDANLTVLYEGDVTTTAPVHQPHYEIKLLDKDAKITALTQNQISHVSTLVYLDGKTIENSDVAASVATSMTGKMNLQFASDATLVPMEYGDLHQTGTKTEEVDVTASSTQATEYTPTSVANATWAFKGTTPENWTIDASSGKVTIPVGATATEVVITATVDGKVVKEITLKVTAGT